MNTKSSTTLRFLESHEVFTLEEFLSGVDPSVVRRTRYLNLQNAVKRDQATRLTRGLYASNLGAYRDRVPNPLLVASKVASDSVLAYHSALEAHGVAHTPSRTVYFTSSRKVVAFETRGYSFQRAPEPRRTSPAHADAAFVTRARAGDTLVAVTSRERTLVDCLARLDLAGGLEELLRSAGGFTTVSSELIAGYARLIGSPTLTARAGWLTSLHSDAWLPTPEPLDEMRRSLGRGTYWLQRRRPGVEYDFVADWRLYIPAHLPLQGGSPDDEAGSRHSHCVRQSDA